MIDWYKEACSGPRTPPPPSLQQLQAGSTCSGFTDQARQTLNLCDSAGNNIHHINFFHPPTVQRFLSPFPADARHDTVILALQRVEPERLCCSAAASLSSTRRGGRSEPPPLAGRVFISGDLNSQQQPQKHVRRLRSHAVQIHDFSQRKLSCKNPRLQLKKPNIWRTRMF